MEKYGGDILKKTVIGIALAVAACLCILLFSVKSEKTPGLLDKIDSYKGYIRVISQEEYDFYSYFVERDLGEEVSEEELRTLVEAYAAKVNAVFYLGNQLELCEPYSFEAMQLRLEQENASRQAKLDEGEVVYGVQQFTLNTYFQYTMDNLQASLMGYLEENADREILKMAEKYYEAHREDFRSRTEVVYEQQLGGVTEMITADADMISYFGKSDPGLADFLGGAEIEDVYEDETNYEPRTIVLKEISYSKDGYKNNAEMALYRLVRNELYDSVIETVVKNNPVEFE